MRGYFLALGSTIGCGLVWLALNPLLDKGGLSVFLLAAVFIAGRSGGVGPALTSLLAGVPPYLYVQYWRHGEVNSALFGMLGVYIGAGLALVSLTRSERNSRRLAEASAAESKAVKSMLEQEVHERRLAEQQLRERHERFELALETGRIGAYDWELASGQVAWSPTMSAIYGYPCLERTIRFDESRECIHPDDRPKIDTAIATHKDPSISERVVYRVVRKDGAVRWVEGLGRKFFDANGKLARIIGFCVDITEHKEAELAVQAGREQLQQFIDNAPSLFYSKDREGRFLLINQRFLDAYHFTREQILGHTDFDLFAQEFAQSYADNDKVVWRENQPRLFEEYDAAGNTFISVKFPLRDRSGAMVAIGGVSTDITERKKILADLQAERELLRNIIAVQENEKRLLCCEFHDGVLQYVTGSQMLLEGRRRSAAPLDDTDLDTAIANLRRATEEGRQAIRGLRPPALDDTGVVAAIYDLIHQPTYADFEIDFAFDELDRLPDLVETSLYRVAQESLNNVKKHSSAKRVEIRLRRDQNDVVLEVQDDGRGFDPNARRAGSFGLLGMSERLRMLGGECIIDGQPGAGTRVRARAPLPKETESEGQI